VTLRDIELLDSELDSLSEILTLKTRELTLSPYESLIGILSSLLADLIQAHEDLSGTQLIDVDLSELITLAQDLPQSHYFRESCLEYLIPCMEEIQQLKSHGRDYRSRASSAWLKFAIGGLLLFVPDKPFDPALRPFVERQLHAEHKKQLSAELIGLQAFEALSSGQSQSNYPHRIIVEESLLDLGEQPPMPSIVRPDQSQLSELQGEFSNLLITVQRLSSAATKDSGWTKANAQELQLLGLNVSQIQQRLDAFPAYRDITMPIKGFLTALRIAIDLDHVDRQAISGLGKQSPLLMPFLNPQHRLIKASNTNPDRRLAELQTVAVYMSVDSQNTAKVLEASRIFDFMYENWRDKLEKDKEEATERSGIYRYRGLEADDEPDVEEMKETFPTYEETDVAVVNQTFKALSSSSVAMAHANIFTVTKSPSFSMLAWLEHAATKVDARQETGSNTESIPALLLSLNSAMEKLHTTPSSKAYNFYVDANIAEAKNSMQLVYRIQARFVDLRTAWPEHATLHDVLDSCDEMLAFRHVEPVAKLLTKAEKLHGYIHEWQTVASKEFTAVSLYDDLTSLLISWRRLELSSWARLLDIEEAACREDALAWWFVAYEVVIAAPRALLEQADAQLDIHIMGILEALQSFFGSTCIGQFSQRLQLLRQLKEQARLLATVEEFHALKQIPIALDTFIRYYQRFEPEAAKVIQKGRETLEKDIKEVLLLASWKDTNIIALRDSARRSHHKLFKVIHKYRALLAKPMQPLLRSFETLDNVASVLSPDAVAIAPTPGNREVQICQELVPEWSTRPARFIQLSKTVSSMTAVAAFPSTVMDASAYMNDFAGNLVSSMAELQKQTPSTLTEENKDTVRHLKSQKRKLLADTLKAFRQMGLNSNMGIGALEKQRSVAVVLASVGQVGTDLSNEIDPYFYKSLDLLEIARESRREHSGDLTGAEVARSGGYIESLLSSNIKRLNVLSHASTSLSGLDKTLKDVSKISSVMNTGYQIVSTENRQPYSDPSAIYNTVDWLPGILEFASKILEVQYKLGKIDGFTVHTKILNWASKFEAYKLRLHSLPQLPNSVSTRDQDSLLVESSEALLQLQVDMDEWTNAHPYISYMTSQIEPWLVAAKHSSLTKGNDSFTIAQLNDNMVTACNTVLVAVQQMAATRPQLPTSAEDTSWMTSYDVAFQSSLRALHIEEIGQSLSDAFQTLGGLENPGQGANAVFAMASPIFEQYSTIARYELETLAAFHRSVCKLSYISSKAFIEIASKGFCTPGEKSDAQDGKTEKLEGGTGLGDGEGAEDISKDIEDDEDLSELAQEPAQKGEKEDMENQDDAVDIEDDLEGQMSDASGKEDDGSGDEEDEDENDMDEEVGDVDDLDPTAVDEKMWDGNDDDTEKDKEGQESKGQASKDEELAAQENEKKDGAEEGEEDDDSQGEEEGAQEKEEVQQDEAEAADPRMENTETLDLPEEMDLDGNDEGDDNEKEQDDEKMDELSDVDENDEQKETNEQDDDGSVEDGDVKDPDNVEDTENGNPDPEVDEGNSEDGEDEAQEQDLETEIAAENDEETEDTEDVEDETRLLQEQTEDAINVDDAVPSDVQGSGQDQDQDNTQEEPQGNSAQRSEGTKQDKPNPGEEAGTDEGTSGMQESQQKDTAQDQSQEQQSRPENQIFRKLGDALENFHRQQRKILEATDKEEETPKQNTEQPLENADFEHLPDEESKHDTQALGAATAEQVNPIDDAMAVDSEAHENPETFPEDPKDEAEESDHDMEVEEQVNGDEQEQQEDSKGVAGTFIGRRDRDNNPAQQDIEDVESPESVADMDNQLSNVQISSDLNISGRSSASARELWQHYTTTTLPLSQTLTEQLRLILAPTLATKMRGDFRTGKRLNIKRIIPYIASQYKRDKIWMRRSLPSKRSYQIMLAVDDSRSMLEGGPATAQTSSGEAATDLPGAGGRALETLALVSRSLSMLEVGEICIVSFGSSVQVAHPFSAPFSAEAGSKVFESFGFQQTRTDVKRLVKDSIELFREARNASSMGGQDNLWQLEMILSDGLCEDHETITRLVRQAQEERIMLVFIIIDIAATSSPSPHNGDRVGAERRGRDGGSSILDLKQVKFDEDGGPRMERYLDTFPFGNYLVVRDIRELPGVLAQALRQWFSEVADASG
jgi:midasin